MKKFALSCLEGAVKGSYYFRGYMAGCVAEYQKIDERSLRLVEIVEKTIYKTEYRTEEEDSIKVFFEMKARLKERGWKIETLLIELTKEDIYNEYFYISNIIIVEGE